MVLSLCCPQKSDIVTRWLSCTIKNETLFASGGLPVPATQKTLPEHVEMRKVLTKEEI